ncbi:MAG: DUF3565 domain-containing protein [Gammaproteobacteria bacterium]|nr:DUF3565 domain-containing protein [Gammaproteobacteria bacterium]
MQRKIISFHQDADKHWTATLDCGHTQHVRHNPPWQNRPWILHAQTREKHIGKTLNCRLCEAPQ